jgi:hypothetical protein
MALPEVGARIRAGANATVLFREPPNAAGNVRLIVEDDHGRLGWIMYYPNQKGSDPEYYRSNISLFRSDQAEALRARLVEDIGE